jgi:pyridoxal phosphate enzyme (YggS family)
MTIADNLAAVRQRMRNAAERAGRDPGEIALMAVSKTHSASVILEAIAAGQSLFGENRVQEFAAKIEELRAGAPPLGKTKTRVKFHLIGHLQSNKAARAAELFEGIDSVDSLRLAERLNEAAGRLGRRLEVLLEVNIGGEAAKSGLDRASPELRNLVEAQSRLPHLAIRGLMTVPPFTAEAEGARRHFQRLRELRDELRASSGLALEELSMGMSHDFEVAIEEGSTCVRVGTAIFGERPPRGARAE